MGHGFHGNNWISPQYSVRIYMTYICPTQTDDIIMALKQSSWNLNTSPAWSHSISKMIIKELQSLPLRTAKEAFRL